MIGMTMCSGIGAPEMAAPWVDWRFASEIEAFPRAVLQERLGYRPPDDHRQGAPLLWSDMTEITPDLLRLHGIPMPDLIVAGTPCQSFSVAGLRQGTEDPRGNLTLAFVEIVHAIVSARPDGRLTVVWENVPGVLSDRGNAFGAFLGGLVGALDSLIPEPQPARGRSSTFWKWHPGGEFPVTDEDGEPTGEVIIVEPHHRVTWPSEGMVQGPRARAAWSVLDAQWFGVAQRRRRVFVVVDFGGAVDPAQILLEPDSLRGDTPPRREAGKDAAGTLSARAQGGGELGADFYLDGGLKSWPADVASTLNAHFGDKMGLEDQHALSGAALFVPVAFDCNDTEAQAVCATGTTTHRLTAEGHDASEDGTGRGTPVVAFDLNQITSKTNRSQPDPAVHHTLPAATCPPHLATPWHVRRLTPAECARLQGFPDDHCAITYRGKPATDGPQYKAYGNSMAVPVMRWILDRIRVATGEVTG